MTMNSCEHLLELTLYDAESTSNDESALTPWYPQVQPPLLEEPSFFNEAWVSDIVANQAASEPEVYQDSEANIASSAAAMTAVDLPSISHAPHAESHCGNRALKCPDGHTTSSPMRLSMVSEAMSDRTIDAGGQELLAINGSMQMSLTVSSPLKNSTALSYGLEETMPTQDMDQLPVHSIPASPRVTLSTADFDEAFQSCALANYVSDQGLIPNDRTIEISGSWSGVYSPAGIDVTQSFTPVSDIRSLDSCAAETKSSHQRLKRSHPTSGFSWHVSNPSHPSQASFQEESSNLLNTKGTGGVLPGDEPLQSTASTKKAKTSVAYANNCTEWQISGYTSEHHSVAVTSGKLKNATKCARCKHDKQPCYNGFPCDRCRPYLQRRQQSIRKVHWAGCYVSELVMLNPLLVFVDYNNTLLGTLDEAILTIAELQGWEYRPRKSPSNAQTRLSGLLRTIAIQGLERFPVLANGSKQNQTAGPHDVEVEIPLGFRMSIFRKYVGKHHLPDRRAFYVAPEMSLNPTQHFALSLVACHWSLKLLEDVFAKAQKDQQWTQDRDADFVYSALSFSGTICDPFFNGLHDMRYPPSPCTSQRYISDTLLSKFKQQTAYVFDYVKWNLRTRPESLQAWNGFFGLRGKGYWGVNKGSLYNSFHNVGRT
ncbi:hypothetical protein P152DRAFT_88391 [Eremomyces bilateralis CBS 781.70]|uniref:Uncharacterized protein n=1 Tax=Eremomyces bilateralis CBS 781.70 TaxID=1392243 RepID=A0A6G1FXG5_9PEZI|nr:uncharacterized protein P152DRAFT_88391 [Eremomyces bilateralis CBS 781.70]KAF1810527.1 hypothetical protein P152DRAFT_88391 [Eremomyces bilateralis CBS 781.70]